MRLTPASQLFAITILTSVLFFSGCADHNKSIDSTPSAHSKFGYNGTNNDAPFVSEEVGATTNTIATPPSPTAESTPATPPANPFLSPTPAPTSATRDLAYGTPVPGKPGFVTSPHSPSAGYVDVRGFPPGTEVKDPYSGKVFLVP